MTGFRFSSDELTVLSSYLGFEQFPGVGEQSFRGFSSETRLIAARAARRGLLARGFVTIDESGLVHLDPDVESLVREALEPDLVVTVERHDRQVVRTWLFLVLPETMIEHSVSPEGIHWLARLPSTTLIDRLLEVLALEEQPVVDAEPLETTLGMIQAIRFDAEKTDVPEHPFAAAIRGECYLNLVTTLHSTGEIVEGGWIGWFQAPEKGIWQIQPETGDDAFMSAPQPEDTAAVITSTSREPILDELLSYLPDGQ